MISLMFKSDLPEMKMMTSVKILTKGITLKMTKVACIRPMVHHQEHQEV